MKQLKYIALLSVVLLASCKSGRQYFPTDVPRVPVPIVRFDKAVLNLETAKDSVSLRSAVEELYEEYPEFMPFWVEEILGIPTEDTAYLCEVIPQFLSDTTYGFMATNAKCAEMFADISDIQQELDEAFGRLSFLEGKEHAMQSSVEAEVPTLYFFVSGFNRSISGTPEGNIAVGVDMYLGSDYEYYNRVVYEYQKQTMRKECIPVDVISYYLFTHTPFTSEKSRLLENMIYRGKVMFVVSLLFPKETPWEVAGYTREQWNWCVQNERAIWGLMMDKKDLYKTDPLVMTGYLNDGPFTAEISQQSPGRLGMWVGWRIVESYMEHHPEVSLPELLADGDAQHILEESYYKP